MELYVDKSAALLHTPLCSQVAFSEADLLWSVQQLPARNSALVKFSSQVGPTLSANR